MKTYTTAEMLGEVVKGRMFSNYDASHYMNYYVCMDSATGNIYAYDKVYNNKLVGLINLDSFFMERIWVEYKIPVDWSKVPVDTKVEVRNEGCDKWLPYHFAKYEDGKVWTWLSGTTSWTTKRDGYTEYNEYYYTYAWKFARLAE